MPWAVPLPAWVPEVALKECSGSPVTCLPHLWHGDSSKWINMLCSGQKGSAHGRGDGELTSTRGFTYQRAVALETQCGQVCESRQEPFPGGPAAGLVQGHVERNADDKGCQNKTRSKRIHAPQCSSQHCLQWPRHRNDLSTKELMKKMW